MRVRTLSLLVASLLMIVLATVAMAAAQLTEYYFDWATSKEGASITSPCKTIPGLGIQKILDPVKGEESCIFADGIEQREEFTIDLGQERKLGALAHLPQCPLGAGPCCAAHPHHLHPHARQPRGGAGPVQVARQALARRRHRDRNRHGDGRAQLACPLHGALHLVE